MYFGMKSYLKSTRNHTAKHALRRLRKLLIVECNRLISLPRSIKCLTTLEEFYINECKKLDLMMIKKKKKKKGNNSTSFPFPLYCNI
jgi:hypothetical protein